MDFQDLDHLVFWNWTLVVFRDMDLDFWTWTFSIFQDMDLDVWIWILLDFQDLDLHFGCLDFGCFLQDIGVDRDVKMLISSAVPFQFRAPVVFLRRLVISSGFSDFSGLSSGYRLPADLIQM